ncbi:MAG: NAD(+)/NADH kinase [Candidatus Aenigmarchaeota archaeon]|nr:NAD(+)/NADH kinase [Candidatus Aenigmarchaeota archaeon]
MRIWIESPYDFAKIERMVRKSGIKVSRTRPDFVIAYGGDGTILIAERKYPGVPKIPIPKSRICGKCFNYSAGNLPLVLEKLKKKEYTIQKETKVEGIYRNKKIIGLNEIQIRNRKPNVALRFSLKSGSVNYKMVIGDGLVASTPYGSTAYYRAMGYDPFAHGIRIGLNNCMPKSEPIEIRKIAKVKILREEGVLLADNNDKFISLEPGSVVTIRQSKEKARFAKIL